MFCAVVHQDDGTVSQMLVVEDTVCNLFCSVVFPVKRIGIGYSFRWKRNVEKRDGGDVLNGTNMEISGIKTGGIFGWGVIQYRWAAEHWIVFEEL